MTKTLMTVALMALAVGTFAAEASAKTKASNTSVIVVLGVGTQYGISGAGVLGYSHSKAQSSWGQPSSASGSADGSGSGKAGSWGTKGSASGSVTSSASAGGGNNPE
jgi:hypothetical protein